MSKELENKVAELRDMKKVEDAHKERRSALEMEIYELLDDKPEVGKIVTTEVGGCKVTINAPLRRTLDVTEWQKIEASVPESFRPVCAKLTLDAKKYTALRELSPEWYDYCAAAVIAKPGKISVSVKEVT